MALGTCQSPESENLPGSVRSPFANPRHELQCAAPVKTCIRGQVVTDPNVPTNGGASQATSASLLERARDNDRTAWDRIVYLYSPLVFAWCRRWGLRDEDTLDVGQDVMRLVFTHLGAFRRDCPGDSFRRWLKAIARNRVRDFHRRNDHRQQAVAAFGGEHPALTDAQAEDENEGVGEQKLVLRRALDLVRMEFEPRTWDAFWRVSIDETPAADVAQALGVSVNVVYLARSRVLRRLADQFAELIDGWQATGSTTTAPSVGAP
jgi:RNA polymerase sigma-70 factor, ECF subfamily